MNEGDYLRLHFPLDGLSGAQRARAVRLGSRVEAEVADMLRRAKPDRVLATLESYFADRKE